MFLLLEPLSSLKCVDLCTIEAISPWQICNQNTEKPKVQVKQTFSIDLMSSERLMYVQYKSCVYWVLCIASIKRSS